MDEHSRTKDLIYVHNIFIYIHKQTQTHSITWFFVFFLGICYQRCLRFFMAWLLWWYKFFFSGIFGAYLNYIWMEIEWHRHIGILVGIASMDTCTYNHIQVPQDRTIVTRVLRTVSLPLFVCMSTISSCGILVAIALIVFNIWNNHRRYVYKIKIK